MSNDGGSEKGRRDRELMELLNEIRVALPGVQVLFAFLLTVPFTQAFGDLSQLHRKVFFTGFLAAAGATAFLIAPTAYHRIRFREGDKEQMLRIANTLAIIGTVFLAIAINCVVFLITDILFGGFVTALVTVVTAGLFFVLWYGIPGYRQLRDK